jgi:integrase
LLVFLLVSGFSRGRIPTLRSKKIMPLNDTSIRTAKVTRKARKLSDGGGLHLLVQPRGAKLWRLAYRFAGKQKLLSFGIYPAVSLADARARREIAKKHLADGVDPAVQRHIEKQSREITFRLVAEELIRKMQREGRAAATLAKTRWLLEFAFAAFGDNPIAKITAPELLLALRSIESRGRYETARRLRSTCSMVFRYAISTARAERDPTIDLRGALTTPKVKHRAAITEPDGIGALLRAIDGYDGHMTIRLALLLAPLVFVRPGELANFQPGERLRERRVLSSRRGVLRPGVPANGTPRRFGAPAFAQGTPISSRPVTRRTPSVDRAWQKRSDRRVAACGPHHAAVSRSHFKGQSWPSGAARSLNG